jgi:hypothetical protein
MRHRGLRPLFLVMALARCSDTTAPTGPVVTVTAVPTSILPGQRVVATVTVVPPNNTQVDFVTITTRGALAPALGVRSSLTLVAGGRR